MMWARSMPRWSSRPTASAAMSDSVYGTSGSGLARQRGAQHGAQVDLDSVELRRQPAVAVVEADHEVPAVGELLAEGVLPGDHLSREAHDQEEGGVLRRPEGLVFELDAPTERCSRHGEECRRHRVTGQSDPAGRSLRSGHDGLRGARRPAEHLHRALRARLAAGRGPRLRLDLGVGPLLLGHAWATTRSAWRPWRATPRWPATPAGCAADHWCTALAIAIPRCWPTPSAPSTSSPAVGPTSGWVLDGARSSTTPTASPSRR